MAEHKYTNKLADEKSPYLLQHAHNPVDWHPWGDEPFAIAKKENKPILVSIGYATCHWCHVMERESFEDPGLAETLNASFVAIKVDREERPDVDSIYMKAIQALGQSGGWPLNVFLTPEGVPFYGGTYFPPERKFNRPSFGEVLKSLDNTWKNEQEKIQKQSKALMEHLNKTSEVEAGKSAESLSYEGEDQAVKLFSEYYDPLNHGFKFQQQNKFPAFMGLSLLLRHHFRTGNEKSLEMTENTLLAMKNGGIYDQIGGGLCRYSTDYKWLIPHFEKMLYDNALFINSLIETYQVTKKEIFAEHARNCMNYIARDMTSPEGAFYSAEDADSEGHEGKFYVWSVAEIEEVMGKQTAQIFNAYYNVTENGNFEGKNNLNVTESIEKVAANLRLPEQQVRDAIANGSELLFEARCKRIRPLLDDKVLTSWNGMMISAMAKAGRVLDEKVWTDKAEKAMDFIWRELRTEDGSLLRRYREGDARYKGYLFDYTSIAGACLDLYEATEDAKYILRAKELMEKVGEKFRSASGVYYETANDAEELIMRQVSGYDGVEPSGNSNGALVFLRLSAYLANFDLATNAENIFTAFHSELMKYGLNSATMMQALHLYLGGVKEVAIIGHRTDPETEEMRNLARTGFFPNAVFAFAYEDDPDKNKIPLLADKKIANGKATAYVCNRGTCLPPVNTFQYLAKLLLG
jgi:uncharacterized protein YyaL (SSP411 family)